MTSEHVHIQTRLKSPETHATVLHAIFRHKYGEAVYAWDPTTVFLEVKDDFGVELPTELVDKFAAIQTLMTSNAFFERLDAFQAICNALSGNDPSFDVFDPVTVEEVCWAVSEASLNREMLPFGYAVQQFVHILLDQDGYTHDAPEVLDYVIEPEKEQKSLRDTLRQLYKSPNEDVVEKFLDEQLKEMAAQFHHIPELSQAFNSFMHEGSRLDIATL